MVVAFVSGALDEAARTVVETHVDGCDECLALLAGIAKTASIAPLEADDDVSAVDADDHRTADTLRKGARVGRYELLALVGVGAMGAIYSANDPDLRRTVALKLVRARPGRDAPAETERLLREARTMARLTHPNVVAVHDVGTHGGRVFVAMDLIDGESLAAWLARTPRSPADVIAAFVAAGRGLAATHRAGVVHGDFKPENVLVGKDGRVLVTDFGLAHAPAGTRDEARPSAISGTPAYMAPEQLRGGPIDARVDQFSFCVALYEALHGERPFASRRPAELLRAIERGIERDITRGPARARSALRRGLAASPADRWPTMDALLDELTFDARAGWRRVALGGLAVLVFGAALAGAVAIAHREQASCRNAVPAKLSGVWDESRKSAIRESFAATKLPYATDAWSRVEHALDAQTEAWRAMHVDACDASHVRGEQSAELLDLRVACLGERLAEMRALGDVLAHADADVVRNAPAAVAALTPLARCGDALALRAIERPPAAEATRVAALRADLARAKALRDAGRVKDSVTLAETAARSSAALGYRPLEAEAFLLLGEAQVAAGDGAAATTTLQHSAQVADLAKDDVTRARAMTTRLFNDGYLLRQSDRVTELGGQAEAAVTRVGGAADLESARLHALGMALLAKNDLGGADEAFKRAIVLREQAYGAKSRQVAMTVNSRCLVAQKRGDVAAALQTCERALALWTEVLGRNHPDVALGLNNVGGLLEQLERHDEACAKFESSLAIAEAGLGAEHPQIAMTLGNLGECYSARGENEKAVLAQQRALAIRERLFGPESPRVATTLTNLGRAYLGSADPQHALDAFERARSIQKPETDRDERAETNFGLARALWERGPADHDRALALAKGARAGVTADTREQRAIDAWLTAHH